MPNTVIALKKSATPSAVPLPANLANGELAINFADGKLYYKAANGTVASITSPQTNSFGTVNANNTLVVADTPGAVVSIVSGTNINITGDAINDRVVINLNDNVVIPSTGTLKIATVGGDEGGEIKLGNAITNSVLAGDIVIDIYQNRLRFFESGGSNRGAFINLASAAIGVGTDLLAAASSTDAAFDKANTANITADRAWNHANAAFTTANIAFANANTVMISAQAAFTVANSGFLHANAAFATVNSAFATINVAFANANTVMISAQAAFTVANAAFLHANSGYAFANSIAITANLAFTHANAAFAQANVAPLAFGQANTARDHANAAFARANAGGSIPITVETTNATRYIVFESDTSGSLSNANVSTALTFNPSTGTLSSTLFNSTSDENFKYDVKPIENALGYVDGMNGVKFKWKNNDQPSIGVIAQDIEKILPELVNNEGDYKTVNYNGIIAILIQAVKELKMEVDDLKTKYRKLEE